MSRSSAATARATRTVASLLPLSATVIRKEYGNEFTRCACNRRKEHSSADFFVVHGDDDVENRGGSTGDLGDTSALRRLVSIGSPIHVTGNVASRLPLAP